MSGAIVAALAGLGLGAGYLWWQKKQAAAAAAPSTCETLCIAAAKAAGVTGDLSAICKQGCNLEGLAQGVKNTAVSVGTTVAGVLGIGGGAKFCTTCCPTGSALAYSNRPDGSTTSKGEQSHVRDQRDGALNAGGNVMGAVCVDSKTGAILGTVTDKFNPYTTGGFSSAPTPTTKVPMPSSTPSTSLYGDLLGRTQTTGGVSVTTRTPTTTTTTTTTQRAVDQYLFGRR